jgi:hypothetical protein
MMMNLVAVAKQVAIFLIELLAVVLAGATLLWFIFG